MKRTRATLPAGKNRSALCSRDRRLIARAQKILNKVERAIPEAGFVHFFGERIGQEEARRQFHALAAIKVANTTEVSETTRTLLLQVGINSLAHLAVVGSSSGLFTRVFSTSGHLAASLEVISEITRWLSLKGFEAYRPNPHVDDGTLQTVPSTGQAPSVNSSSV